jgi:hypothetical protein
MTEAESGQGTEDATKQIELALFLEARYLPPKLGGSTRALPR